ncbi:hypothetical protein O3P69_006469 [Scylla paramamosain]|uniref:Uncharacterized protein n=1 Tax=Scylla paramamosain TaxID=85552 RepID=A0AAW0U446_SCYPA
MADHRGQSQETPRRSSTDKKRQRREDDVPRGDVKKRKDAGSSPHRATPHPATPHPAPPQRDDDAPPPAAAVAAAGPSGQSVTSAAAGDVNYDRLSCLLGSLIEKLDKKAEATTSPSSFTGVHDLSSSGSEDGELAECLPDPLDGLDALCSPQHSGADPEEEVFIQALDEFSGIFHSEDHRQDAEEITGGQGNTSNGLTSLANPGPVPCTLTGTEIGGHAVIGRSFEDQGLSPEVASFLLKSWREGLRLPAKQL